MVDLDIVLIGIKNMIYSTLLKKIKNKNIFKNTYHFLGEFEGISYDIFLTPISNCVKEYLIRKKKLHTKIFRCEIYNQFGSKNFTMSIEQFLKIEHDGLSEVQKIISKKIKVS